MNMHWGSLKGLSVKEKKSHCNLWAAWGGVNDEKVKEKKQLKEDDWHVESNERPEVNSQEDETEPWAGAYDEEKAWEEEFWEDPEWESADVNCDYYETGHPEEGHEGHEWSQNGCGTENDVNHEEAGHEVNGDYSQEYQEANEEDCQEHQEDFGEDCDGEGYEDWDEW
jgi:hypothetical protein